MNERLREESIPTPEIVLEEFAKTPERILQRARLENRLIDNPSGGELRSLTAVEPGIKKLNMGALLPKVNPTAEPPCSQKIALIILLAKKNWNYWLKPKECLPEKN